LCLNVYLEGCVLFSVSAALVLWYFLVTLYFDGNFATTCQLTLISLEY